MKRRRFRWRVVLISFLLLMISGACIVVPPYIAERQDESLFHRIETVETRHSGNFINSEMSLIDKIVLLNNAQWEILSSSS